MERKTKENIVVLVTISVLAVFNAIMITILCLEYELNKLTTYSIEYNIAFMIIVSLITMGNLTAGRFFN